MYFWMKVEETSPHYLSSSSRNSSTRKSTGFFYTASWSLQLQDFHSLHSQNCKIEVISGKSKVEFIKIWEFVFVDSFFLFYFLPFSKFYIYSWFICSWALVEVFTVEEKQSSSGRVFIRSNIMPWIMAVSNIRSFRGKCKEPAISKLFYPGIRKETGMSWSMKFHIQAKMVAC